MNAQLKPRELHPGQTDIAALAEKYNIKADMTIPDKRTAPIYTQGDNLLVHLRANGIEATLSDRHNGTTYNIELHEPHPRGASSAHIENLFQWFSAMSQSQAAANTATPPYADNDMTAAVNYAKETSRLFAEHRYVEAFAHYMADPNGGAGRPKATLERFAEAMYARKDIHGTPRFPHRFAAHKAYPRDALPIQSIPGFGERDVKTLTALVNDAGALHDLNQTFQVSHDGYEFACILREDLSQKDGYRFDVELKATPFQWIETAQQLGYEFIQLRDGAVAGPWRFNKINSEGGFGIIDYPTLGEAAKAACFYEGAVNKQGIAPQPEMPARFIQDEGESSHSPSY